METSKYESPSQHETNLLEGELKRLHELVAGPHTEEGSWAKERIEELHKCLGGFWYLPVKTDEL